MQQAGDASTLFTSYLPHDQQHLNMWKKEIHHVALQTHRDEGRLLVELRSEAEDLRLQLMLLYHEPETLKSDSGRSFLLALGTALQGGSLKSIIMLFTSRSFSDGLSTVTRGDWYRFLSGLPALQDILLKFNASTENGTTAEGEREDILRILRVLKVEVGASPLPPITPLLETLVIVHTNPSMGYLNAIQDEAL